MFTNFDFCYRFVIWLLTKSLSPICVSASATPFQVTFVTDGDEVTQTADTAKSQKNEQSSVPGGIVGFHLNYVQQPC